MIEIKRIRAKRVFLTVASLGILVFVACAGPRGWPGPVVDENNILYVGSTEGTVIALDPADNNKILWEWAPETQQGGGFLGCASAGQLSAGKMYGAPAVANGLVYIGAYDGNVYAIDSTAAPYTKWKSDLRSPIVGGVYVDGDTVFVGASNGKFYALAAESGGMIWEYPRDGKIGKVWTTPTVAQGVVYFGSLDHKLYALDAATGEPKWNEPFETGGAITAPPLVVDGVVYIGSFDSKFYAVDAETGEQKWIFDQAENWFWSKAYHSDGIIYVGSLDNNVYALDAEYGSQIWSRPLKTAGPVRSSPVIAGGMLVVASEDGWVYLADPMTGIVEGGRIEFGVKMFSSATTTDNKVYLMADDNTLYVLDGGTGERFPSIPLSK